MIKEFLNKLFRKNKSLVNVIQYPNEYIIETFNSSDSGIWVRSNFISLLPIDLDINEFEKLINLHLNTSKKVNYRKYDLKPVKENYARVTKKSSLKKQMENAKQVTIYRNNNLIEITPTINGGTSGDLKGFRPIKNKKIVLNNELKENKIALNVIELFAECI